MNSHLGKWVALVSGGAAFALVFFCLGGSAGSQRSVKLPDGTTITLEKVSFGTEHRYPPRASSKTAEGFHPTPNPALGLFFHRTAAPTNSYTEDALWLVCDETGVEYGRSGEGSARMLSSGPRSSSEERLEVRLFNAFPRRAKTLVLRVYSWQRIDAGNIPLINAGEMRIPNPAYGSYPVWTPEALPATRKAGDLAVVLTQLEAVVDPAEKLRFRKKDLKTGIRASYRITRNGEPAPDWRVESIRLSDSTSNSLHLWAGDRFPRDPAGQFTSQWRLGLEEPAWKMRVELSHHTQFAPEKSSTLIGVPVAAARHAGPSIQASILGTNIMFKQVRHENNWGGNASVELQVWPKRESFRVALLKVTDDRGRDIEIIHPPAGFGDFVGPAHYFGIQLPADAKTLNLTVALQESRFVEFIAKPEETILQTAEK